MDMFKKTTFVGFCFASAYKLPEELGLSTEQLICLYKECIEMAKHCNDISTTMNSCIQFVKLSNSIGRHAESLRCLKEILPLVVGILSAELIVHKYLSITYMEFNEFENVVLHAKKWIEIAQTIGDKENEMYGHHYMGRGFSSLARYDDVIDCGKKCLKIAQEIDSPEVMMAAYDCIMVAYRNMRKYDDTILYAHKLLDCAMENNDQKTMMIVAYLELGRAHYALNHYQDATEYGQKCIEIAREIEERFVENWTYLFLGKIYNALSDYGNAIIYCKKGIELAITIGDKDAEAHAYGVLGDIYYSLEKYDDAIQNYKQCIDIVKRFEKKPAVNACLYLGKIYHKLDQYNDAVHYYKKCINMAQETCEKEIEAQACLDLSCLYRTLVDKESIDNAIQHGKKCLDISQEIDDKKTEMDGYHCLAHAYMESMQLNEASLCIDAGMAIATELGDKEAEENFKVIRSGLYCTVGLKNKVDAPLLKELIEIPTCPEDELLQDLDQAVKTGDKKKKSRAFIRLYKFYSSRKEYVKTINCLQRFKEMNVDRCVNLFCITEMGSFYQLMGQNETALHSFEQGLPTAESCSVTGQLSLFYLGFGHLLCSLNRELNFAEDYLRKAMQCFEAIFTTLGSRDEFKISIFDQYIHSYKLLAILLIQGDQMEEALLVLDRCRARALKDLMMSNFKMKQEKSNDEQLKYSDVFSLVSRNDFSIAFYSLFFNAFLKFFIDRETNLHYSRCPNHSLQIDVDRSFKEMGVGEVVDCENRSLDKEEDIQKEQRRCIEEHEGLNQPTVSLLNLDSNTGESNGNSAETKGSTLEALFDILECDRILSSKQGEVVIIPEGPLCKVPFPALRDPRTGKYLSETNRIRLAPSLATLKNFKDFPTDQTSDAKPLIIGNPLVGKVMMDGEECDISSLPGAKDEAKEISRLLGVRPLLATEATKPAVLERLKQGVSVVHIAAHGSLTKGRILLAPSHGVRATKVIPDEEDYMLTMADVQKAQVRAQLVALSCCHSGRGEIRAEGVVSMCRAFLASGARAVVASLWAIDDDATLYFMTSFYGNLKNGKSASTSLQLTMNEMRNTYIEPKYWAPFFIMGDDITLKSVFQC